jgi:hypothetical protein
MRSSLRAIVLTALLAGLTGPAPAHEAGQRVPTAGELRQCPHLARVDWPRVARELAEWKRDHPAPSYDFDTEHRRIRGPWPLPDIGRAEIVIDIAIGPGETQQYPTSTSAFAWREPGGQWQVDRVDHVRASLPPPPPGAVMEEGWEERAKRPVTRGPLSPAQAATIDRVLADPCFAIQPDYTPMGLPLPDGRIESCYGAISRTVRIRRGAETRLVSDLCAHWPSAALAHDIMYAALSLGTLVEQAARARFPGAQIQVTALREAGRRGMTPVYCGELSVDGHLVPMMFESWRNGAWPRDDLYVPGGPAHRWTGNAFEVEWRNRCAAPEGATSQP